MTMSEIFRQVAPSGPVPEELQALDARVQEMAPIYERLGQMQYPEEIDARRFVIAENVGEDEAAQPAPEAVSEDVARLQLAVDESACPHNDLFQDAGCPSFRSEWTITKATKTNKADWPKNDITKAWGGACSYRGEIRYRVGYAPWWSWTYFVDVDLNTGERKTNWLASSLGDFDIRTLITDSDGDGFHFCMSGQG